MTSFTSTDEFVQAFGDLQGAGFYDPITLQDTRVGFSIKKHYPADIRYKPAIGQKSKNPDNVAVIWVVYGDPKQNKKCPKNIAPLSIRIGTMSQYRAKHWDYNFDDIDGDSPSKESLDASLATPQPLELTIENKYFFDHQTNSFVDAKGRTIAGIDVLEIAFATHCNTVHLLRGMALRLKLAWQSNFSGFILLAVQMLVGILKQGFGRTLESDDLNAGFFSPYKTESLKKLDEDSMDLLGYKASKHVIILFCALTVVVGYYKYKHPGVFSYISWLDGKTILSATHGVFAVWILDVAVPWILFYIMNALLLWRKRILFMRFSFGKS